MQLFVQAPPWLEDSDDWKDFDSIQHYKYNHEQGAIQEGDRITIAIFQPIFACGGFRSAAFARSPGGQKMVAKHVLRESSVLAENLDELEVHMQQLSG